MNDMNNDNEYKNAVKKALGAYRHIDDKGVAQAIEPGNVKAFVESLERKEAQDALPSLEYSAAVAAKALVKISRELEKIGETLWSINCRDFERSNCDGKLEYPQGPKKDTPPASSEPSYRKKSWYATDPMSQLAEQLRALGVRVEVRR